MPTIKIFEVKKNLKIEEIVKAVNGKKFEDFWLTAKVSKYNEKEVFIQYWFYADMEKVLKKVLDVDELEQVVSILKEKGKQKLLKRVYAFINTHTHTLEIYSKTQAEKIKEVLEQLLDTEFFEIALGLDNFEKLGSSHSNKTKTIGKDRITFQPKIKYLTDNKRYFVTINKNAEIKLSSNEIFTFRPRFEIRQIVFMISTTKGFLDGQKV
jgi:hypothetical protein